MLEFKPGDRVRVRYDFQPSIVCIVVENQGHWLMVEQLTDYETEQVRPRFLALTAMAQPA